MIRFQWHNSIPDFRVPSSIDEKNHPGFLRIPTIDLLNIHISIYIHIKHHSYFWHLSKVNFDSEGVCFFVCAYIYIYMSNLAYDGTSAALVGLGAKKTIRFTTAASKSASSSSSSIIIHHHPSSSIIIHHHPSSSIIIHHHPSSCSFSLSLLASTCLSTQKKLYTLRGTNISPFQVNFESMIFSRSLPFGGICIRSRLEGKSTHPKTSAH